MEDSSPGQGFHFLSRNSSMYQSSRGRQCKLTDKMEGFIDLKRKKKVEKVPDLPMPPSQPELGPELSLKQTSTNLPSKSKKTFQTDGPPLLPQSGPIFHHEDPFKKLGVNLLKDPEDDFDKFHLSVTSGTKPVENFVKGNVKYTTVEGLKQMLAEIGPLRGNHGCIVDENFLPDADVYNKEVHYIVDKQLGKGSNGKAELCFDSNSEKPFVKKEILKSSLRDSEVLVPLNLDHENVTKFYGLIQREESPEEGGQLKMELMLEYGGTALNHLLLDDDEVFTVPEIWELTRQGLKALQQLDYFGMVHLDVKPENLCVLRKENGLIMKLTDFGSAKLPQEPVTFCGWTPEYMAPESCKLVLQTIHNVQFAAAVTQNDITGKVDVFAFALVVMYMYKRYHILQKVVTKGKTSYRGFSDLERQGLQLQLMLWLSTMEDLVQKMVPDECDLDMRELLKKMTHHDINTRLSAEQALLEIEEREVKQRQMVPVAIQEEPAPPRTTVPASVSALDDEMPASPLSEPPSPSPKSHIPDIAVNQMEIETGPIKNKTKDKLRWKLQKPYSGPGKDGKTGKRIGSKTMPPQTPVMEMEALTLTYAQDGRHGVQRTEKISQVVTQPTEDLDYHFTEQTVNLAHARGLSPVPISSVDQWVTNLTNGGETKRRVAQRVAKTAGIPQLEFEPEEMDCHDYGLKRDFGKPEEFASQAVGVSRMVSLATANTSSPMQRTSTHDLKKQLVLNRLAAMIKEQQQKIPFGNTHNSCEESQQVQQPEGNLPNLAFL